MSANNGHWPDFIAPSETDIGFTVVHPSFLAGVLVTITLPTKKKQNKLILRKILGVNTSDIEKRNVRTNLLHLAKLWTHHFVCTVDPHNYFVKILECTDITFLHCHVPSISIIKWRLKTIIIEYFFEPTRSYFLKALKFLYLKVKFQRIFFYSWDLGTWNDSGFMKTC